MKLAFLTSALIFSLSHILFFLRAYLQRHRNFIPGKQDKAFRSIAMLFMLITAIIGSFVVKLLLVAILWLPHLLIIISQFNRRWIKKNPYVLPLTNTVLSICILFVSIGVEIVT